MRRLALLLLMPLAACVPYARAGVASDVRFETLWERDLSGFEQQLAVERHNGADDAWTEVGEAWLRFANCADFPSSDEPEAEIDDPMAAFVYATIRAEDTRRRMLVYQASARRVRIDEQHLFVDVTRAKFFERRAGAIGSDYVQWPRAEEGWADEVPARVAVDSECDTLRARVLETPLRPDDEESPPRRYEDWMRAYFADAHAVGRRFERLPKRARHGTPARVAWQTEFHVARTADVAAEAWAEYGARARRKAEDGRDAERNRREQQRAKRREVALRTQTRRLLEELVTVTPDAVEAVDAARARLLLASYDVRDEQPSRALELLAAARELGLDADNRWGARYLELRLAADAARWDDAIALGDELPPDDVRYFSAYHYRVAVALQRRGELDRFLNVAMKAFRDRPYKADPFLRALYWETLQVLASYPFEERTIELLEEMGPRGGTFERVEEYARIALDRGEAGNAEAAATWLLGHHHDARFHPRYHGVLALAAFVEDDVDRFDEAVADVARRPSAVVDSLAGHRTATFFAHADGELARVLRQMLPVMAEWGESEPARDRRQKWLRVIVEHTQRFVRGTRDTLARPQLVELYRLASALLEDHPRGYAERVGEEEPVPLILGTVRVEGRDLREFEPDVKLVVPAPYSLTLVPRDELPASQWPTRWP